MKYYIIPHSPVSTHPVEEFSIGGRENLKLLLNQGLKRKATGQQTANQSVLASAFAKQVANFSTCQVKCDAWVRGYGDAGKYLTKLSVSAHLFQSLDASSVFRFSLQGCLMKKNEMAVVQSLSPLQAD